MRLSSLLFAGALILAAAPVAAHPIAVDGAAGEWLGVQAPVSNLARISRTASGGGEWVWRDSAGDALSSAGSTVELLELRLTGDDFHLYVQAKLSGTWPTSGDGAPQLMLAIDTDRFFGSGSTTFPDGAQLATSDAAAFEYLLETRFGSGAGARLIDRFGGQQLVGPAALSAGGVLEVAIPWSALGAEGPPMQPWRFSAAVFRSSAVDSPYAVTGATCRAADVVTQYGDTGSTFGTANETSDSVLDHWSDVWFSPRGECYAPITVSEMCFEGGAQAQWVELFNASPNLVSLAGFKIGDAPLPDGPPEGMGQLPAILLLPGQAFVVARNGTEYLARYGVRADAECQANDPGTPDLTSFPQWSSNTAFNVTPAGDEMLVLDGGNTVVDVLTFKNGSWPGVTPHPGAPSQHSLERPAPNIDRDDCASDFIDQASPTPSSTPGVLGVSPVLASGALLALGSPWPNPTRGEAQFALRLTIEAALEVSVLDLSGREVARLVHGERWPAGTHVLRWSGRSTRGERAAPGIYLVRVASGTDVRTTRVVLTGN